MDGRIHERSPRPVHLHRLGDAMAQLHDHADGWRTPAEFVRTRWDHQTFFGDVMLYGLTPAAGSWELLPEEVRARCRRVDERMLDIIAGVADTGLIHADLHLGNALFDGGSVKLVDFDDCGTGRATTISPSPCGNCGIFRVPGLPGCAALGIQRAARPRRPHLDDYIALRQVAFDLWYTGAAQVNSAFSSQIDTVHTWSLAMLDLLQVP
jgi:hypothetical protein